MSTNAFGIDLGTSNIKIYSAADDHIMIEKNMIAIQNKKNIFAYGDSAYEMYEKAPGNIQISYPLMQRRDRRYPEYGNAGALLSLRIFPRGM